jgi:putative membrane protein
VALLAATGGADYWRFVPHPEVWLLIGGLTGLYVYAARVIGPKAVPAGEPPVTRSQVRWFAFGIVLLWLAADWPVHDIGEQYLYFVHMVQHLVLTLVVPPVMLLATPEWLARLVVGRGRVDRIVHRMARPVPAALAFNALILLSHWQLVVNSASSNGLFHYGVHTLLVTAAVLFWVPVCGPFPELRISPPAQMIYLFVTSIIPTVPGAWLTFADGAVYSAYDIPDRLWGISVTSDQQVAGLLMKLVGGTYLWVLITVIFFRWAAREHGDGHRPRPATEVLTWEQVAQELEEHPAPTP